MPFKRFSNQTTMQDVIDTRADDVAAVEALERNKLTGRDVQNVRSAPTSNSDVVTGDAAGDVLNDGTYSYTLRSVNGSLKWDRQTMNVSW